MLALPLAVALLVSPASQDSVRVAASLTSDSVVVGDVFRFQVRVETRGTRPETITLNPLPAGFDIVGTERASSVELNFTGGRRLVTTQSWLLVGRVTGTFTLPFARIVVAGRIYRTIPMPIAVFAGEAETSRLNAVDRIRLVGHLEPTRVYVGQQVTFTAQAEFPRSLRQRRTRPATYQAPNPSGFWAQDLPDPIVIGLRSIDGELYDTQSFRRAFFPLLPGEQTFPPAKLSFEYRVSLGLPADERTLTSDTLVLEVLPIPTEGRPAAYNGAVGRYTMKTAVESTDLEVGEATTLSVEITGRGNVKALPAPSLDAVDGIEVFPPTESAEVDASTPELGGTKRFEWVIVANEPGRLVLPPIEFAAFDPLAERFVVARSDSIPITATGRGGVDQGIDLRPIRGRPSAGVPGWLLSRPFAFAQLIPLLVMLSAWWWARRPASPGLKRVTDERRRRFQRLREESLAADREFWGRLADAIRISIAELLESDSLRGAPVETVREAITAAGVPRASAVALTDLLGSLDRIRFAQGEVAPADAPALVDRADRLLSAMSATLRRSSPAAPTATAVVLLLLLGAVPASAQEAAFDRAVAAYRAADYALAAEAFLEHVAESPSDADGWYDAGNALYRAGETGRAVASWMRAVRLDPRHMDARRNIEAVSPDLIAYIALPVSLTGSEAALVLTGIWWIAGLIIALRIRSHRPFGRVVATGLAAMVLAVLAGLAGINRHDVAVSLGTAVVRADPALKGDALEELPAGTAAEIVDRRDAWIRVRTLRGIEGWVDSSLIEVVPSRPSRAA